MKKILPCFIFFLFFGSLRAAWQLPVTNFQQSEYASGTQSWQIRQQKNGWMYFANNYGLLEYDGYHWSTYGVWNGTVIRSLEIGEEGEIYVGASNEFGKFTANELGKLSYVPMSNDLPVQYRGFGEIWNIHQLPDALYFQSRNYIFRYSPEGFSAIRSEARIVCSAKVRGSIYVGTTSGMYVLAGSQLIALNGSEHLNNKNICAILPYRESEILIGTSFGGLYVFDGSRISPFRTEVDEFLRRNQLYACVASDSLIAFGTVLNGVVITDIRGEHPRYIDNKNGLQNNTILSLYFDREENLWLGLDIGIDRININSPLSDLYGRINFRGSGYTSCIYDDYLYLGTNQGLYYVKWPLDSDNSLTDLTLIEGTQGQIWSLDLVGHTLFCSHNRGLFIIENRRAVPVIEEEGVWRVRAYPGSPGTCVVGSYNGFYLLRKGEKAWDRVQRLSGVNETTRVFEVDTAGQIWFNLEKHVCKLTLNAGADSLSLEEVRSVSGNPEIVSISRVGNRYVFSGPEGTFLINEKGLLEEYTALNELLEGKKTYPVIKEDRSKNLWFFTGSSIKVRLYNKRKKKYEKSLSLLEEKPNFFIGGFEHLLLLDEGQAIAGNTGGFSLAEIKGRNHYTDKTELLIRSVVATQPSDSLIYGQGYPVVPKKTVLSYACNSLRITYSGSTARQAKLQYSYRLEPHDTEWSDWTDAMTKEYTGLPENTYIFKVRARHSQAEQPVYASFTFTVLPPWYRTLWAYTVYTLIVFLFILRVYIHFKKKMRESWKRIEQRKNEELREQQKVFMQEANNREKEIIKLKNDKLEYELKMKSQELANVLLNHLNKNEILTEIKADLKKIGSDVGEKEPDSVKRKILMLQNKISRNIEQNIDWKKFEENFDIVNDKFIRKLSERYPNLTKNERRLCTYIKMGLSSKEIAPLMNLSLRGVEVLRYRMRKKLNFERGIDFLEFFSRVMQSEGEPLITREEEEVLMKKDME